MRRSEPVMAPYTSAHPLDTDILDLIEGTLDEGSARLIESHLDGCLLCRIKRQRLSAAPPIDFADVRDLAVPVFPRIEVQDAPGTDASRGELWLAAGDEAVMVLIRTVRDHGLVVVPVTLDTEAADDETLVLDDTSSPLAVPLAIYERLTISIGSYALRSRVVPVRDVDLFDLVVGQPGVTRGSAIDGPTDPRLEIRQYLIDRLTALDPPDPEEPDSPPAPMSTDDIFSEMVQHLEFSRGSEASVDRLPYLGVEVPNGWAGIAVIDELNVRVVVIDTPRGLMDESERDIAEAVFAKWSASALAVCTSELSDIADLYDYSGLTGRISVDSGERFSGPLLTLSVREAVSKFLDQRISIPTTPIASSARGTAVDAHAIMSQKVAEALDGVVIRGRNATIASKSNGYTAAGSSLEALSQVLQHAFTDDFDVRSIVEVANEDA
jgi:hypothetical protein